MRHATPVASSVGVTIAGGRAQFHVDFGEATFPTRKIFMALVKPMSWLLLKFIAKL